VWIDADLQDDGGREHEHRAEEEEAAQCPVPVRPRDGGGAVQRHVPPRRDGALKDAHGEGAAQAEHGAEDLGLRVPAPEIDPFEPAAVGRSVG
jgi:hypothetical protein